MLCLNQTYSRPFAYMDFSTICSSCRSTQQTQVSSPSCKPLNQSLGRPKRSSTWPTPSSFLLHYETLPQELRSNLFFPRAPVVGGPVLAQTTWAITNTVRATQQFLRRRAGGISNIIARRMGARRRTRRAGCGRTRWNVRDGTPDGGEGDVDTRPSLSIYLSSPSFHLSLPIKAKITPPPRFRSAEKAAWRLRLGVGGE